MDKHFKSDVGVDLVGHFYYLVQFVASRVFVRLVSIDHIDQRSTGMQGVDVLLIFFVQFFRSWKVKDLVANVRVVVSLCTQCRLDRRRGTYRMVQRSGWVRGKRFRGDSSSRRRLSG